MSTWPQPWMLSALKGKRANGELTVPQLGAGTPEHPRRSGTGLPLVISESSNRPEVSLKFLRGFAMWFQGQGLPLWGFHPLSYRGHHLQLPGPPYAPSLPLTLGLNERLEASGTDLPQIWKYTENRRLDGESSKVLAGCCPLVVIAGDTGNP